MTELYQGVERRVQPCSWRAGIMRTFEQGEKRMDRYETKIDDLLQGQSKQALAIQILSDAIGNGLRGDIKRTVEGMEKLGQTLAQVCNVYDVKLLNHEKELSEFKWFRDWANKFKDNAIRNVLTIAFLGGGAVGLIYLYEKYLR